MKITLPLQFLLVCTFIFGLVLFIRTYYGVIESKEGFDAQANSDLQLNACPSGTTSYLSEGMVQCCDGQIVDGICNGQTVCTLSVGTKSMPTCVSLLQKRFGEKSVQLCPPSRANYYENGSMKGCTSGERTPDGKGLKQSPAPVKTCKIYSTLSDEAAKIDSCSNIKKQDTFTCPGGAKPTLVSLAAGSPAVLQCNFLTKDSVPVQCFEDSSIGAFYNFKQGNTWRDTINTNQLKLGFCSIANNYYLNKSLTDAQLTAMIYAGK